MFWPIVNAVLGSIAAAILAYKLTVLGSKFTLMERIGYGLIGAGMILTIGPILSTAPTPFEDWSGTLIRVGLVIYLCGRMFRHPHNNKAAIRQARRHLSGKS